MNYIRKVYFVLLIAFIINNSNLYAGITYKVPGASKDNTIELIIANISTIPAYNLKVVAEDVPSWISFTQPSGFLKSLKQSQELAISFTFSVHKNAPVLKDTVIKFRVVTPEGESWVKEVSLSVLPPDHFELSQNYPNPFNPITKFDVAVPIESHMEVIVYNVLGQKIKTLIDETREPGYHTIEWDGTTDAGITAVSGMYFVRMVSGNFTSLKKIMLMK